MKNLFVYVHIIVLGLLLFSIGCTSDISLNDGTGNRQISVIPQPLSIKSYIGDFTISNTTDIHYNGDAKDAAVYLKAHLNTKSNIKESNESGSNHIFLNVVKQDTKEAYQLTINDTGIKIEGDAAGVFYGVQTLIQLIEEEGSNSQAPYVKIEDQPAFEWRGMHLDVSRHFFDKAFVMEYIDVMAKHKLNTFHWHLTDDHGWRIEIDKYPKLVKAGAWRRGDGMEIPWDYNVYGVEEGYPKYGGYYTKEDIREVLAYAKERHITVVPEIELPAHSWGALHAYPNLSCTGKDWHMGKDWSFSDPYCAGNEETFEFLQNVLTEVIELFPSEYIHIGGDEAQKTRWEECSKCQARIKTEGLKNVQELQSYFIKRIVNFVHSKGRKAIGWDEILEGGLAPGAAVMSWRGEAGGIEAAKHKHEVVMTPGEFLYFDHAQANSLIEGVPSPTLVDVKKVYNYNPIPSSLGKEYKQYIKGVEACLWTESVYTKNIAWDRFSPRVVALSETAWVAKENKNWEQFKTKLMPHFEFMDKHGIKYFIPPPLEEGLGSFVGEVMDIKIESPFDNVDIHYTIDGSTPTINSPKFGQVVSINESLTLKAIHVFKSGRISPVFEKEYKKLNYIEPILSKVPKEGLKISYYKGSIKELASFGQLTVLKGPTVSTEVKIPEGMPKDMFGLQFLGYINIQKEGIYTFYTTSDDGSGLYIDGTMVVDNDGTHGMQEKKGEIALKKGYHRFEVKYFENTGGEGLNVKMKGGGIEKGEISKDLLFH